MLPPITNADPGDETTFSPSENHSAEYHERIEAETGLSCQHPFCLAHENFDADTHSKSERM